MTPYAVFPPRHGPQVRLAGLLGNLGDGWEITHFSQSIQRTDLPWPPATLRAGPHWVEHRMRDPISAAWLVGLSKVGHYPAAYADRLLALFPRRHIRRALARADAVLVSPHYQFPWVRRHTPSTTPIVVDIHSIDADVWPARRAAWTRMVAREIREGEQRAWAAADMVFATSEEDAEVARRAGARRSVIVPNGVDVDRFAPAKGADERLQLRRLLGLPDGPLAIFVGSGGYANVNAVAIIERQQEEFATAGIAVVVVGRVGQGRAASGAVTFSGEVADVAAYLRAADIAICPLLDGSGTSLKSVEYLASGVPVVSSPVGVRGLGVVDGVSAIVRDVEEIPAAAARVLADPDLARRLGEEGRQLAVDRFSWPGIGATAATALGRLVEGQSSGATASAS
jgi:glycosyltransferase involved in cell wall biosynthesis